jgi:hypothetical protein
MKARFDSLSTYRGRGGSASSRGGSPSTRRSQRAASSTFPLDQNPPTSTLNPALGHLFQHLGNNKLQGTQDNEDASAQSSAPPNLLCVVRVP